MGTPDRDGYEMAPQDPPQDRDIEKAKQVEEEEAGWTGLGKDELLLVADTPAWNWTRNVLLVLFWVTWVAMLIAAIWIVVSVPRCPDVEWWEKNVVYQVEPRSFYDAIGDDGVGDLKGLEKKLTHLDDMQVKILYINSIFEQANATIVYPGNHIVDFKKVDPVIGDQSDFESLLEAATEMSIKVILEFIPNHSSDQHPWFLESKSNAAGPKANYYIWSNSTAIPGTEVTMDGQPAWTNVAGRGWYYHRLHSSLPDFNYDNEELRSEITDAMDYWLQMGVDGMVITNVGSVVDSVGDSSSRRRRQAPTTAAVSSAPEVVVSSAAPAAPAASAAPEAAATTGAAAPEPATTKMMVEQDTEEPKAEAEPTVKYVILEDDKLVQDRIEQWRGVFTKNSYLGKYRLLLTSGSDSIASAVTQYGNEDKLLADFPVNTLFLDTVSGTPSGDEISGFVEQWMDAKEEVDDKTADRWNSWMLSNKDVSRVASRTSPELVNVLNTLLLTLPGTPIVMYGDELGMQDNGDSSFAQLAPMSWASTANANFTKGTPWKELDANWKTNNVEELGEKDMSSLNVFKTLVGIHLEPPVVAGTYDLIASTTNGMAYLRRLEDWPTYLVVLNFGNGDEEFEFPSDRVPLESEVVLSTDGKFAGKKQNVQEIKLAGKQAAVFKFKALK